MGFERLRCDWIIRRTRERHVLQRRSLSPNLFLQLNHFLLLGLQPCEERDRWVRIRNKGANTSRGRQALDGNTSLTINMHMLCG